MISPSLNSKRTSVPQSQLGKENDLAGVKNTRKTILGPVCSTKTWEKDLIET